MEPVRLTPVLFIERTYRREECIKISPDIIYCPHPLQPYTKQAVSCVNPFRRAFNSNGVTELFFRFATINEHAQTVTVHEQYFNIKFK